MTITNLSQPYTTPHQVSSDDIDLIKIRSKETSPLTHEDLDDNFANLMNKINSLVDLVGGSSAAISVDGNGKVGIGTDDPKRVLTINHVHPGIRFEDADGDPAHVTQVSSFDGTLYFDSDMANPDNSAGRTGGKGFVFRTDANTTETPSGDELFVIKQDGNVGIGTDPDKPLELRIADDTAYAENVVGNACRIRNISQAPNTFSSLEMYAGQTSAGGVNISRIFAIKESATSTATSLAFQTRASDQVVREAMRIDSAGNVGIGTTLPTSPLTIGSNNTANYPYMALENSYADSQDGTDLGAIFFKGKQPDDSLETGVAIRGRGAGNADNLSNNLPAELLFQTNPGGTSGLVDRMIIDKDGKVGIGSGSLNPASKLDVSGQAYFHDNVDGRAPLYVKQDGTGPSAYFMGGNVGIGTSEPTEGKLVIEDGDAVIKSNRPVLILKDKDGGDVNSQNGYISYRDNSNTERGYVGFGSFNNKNLTVSNNIGDIILHGDNVGIGTAIPDDKLHVNGDIVIGPSENSFPSSAYSYIRPKFAGAAIKMGTNSADWDRDLHFGHYDNNAVFTKHVSIISKDGSVGIGTDDPKGSLHVKCGENQNFVFQKAGTGGNTHLTMQSVNDAGNTNLDMGMGVGGNTLFLSGTGNVGINDASPTDNDHLAFSLKAKGVAGHVNNINQYFKNSNGHLLNSIRHREEQYGASWALTQLSFANYSYGTSEHIGINVVTTANTTQGSTHVQVSDDRELQNYLQAGRQIEFLDGNDESAGIYTIANWVPSTTDLYLTGTFSLASGTYKIRMVAFRSHALTVVNTPHISSPKVGIGVDTPEENLHVRSTVRDDITGIMIDREVHNDSGFVGFYGGFLTTRSDPTSGGLVFGAKVAGANANVFEYHNYFGSYRIVPASSNTTDLGGTDKAWQDVYVKDGTVENSDRNLKQDIEKISEAEEKVARKCKKLLRKYRWKDSVVEKGDSARIHFGIIAQDLENAFKSEGLDAGDYGMFIKNIWWEKERVIPAVEAVEAVDAVYDEEDNLISPAVEAVEAKDEETVVDTFYSKDEAPEGSAKKTRRGVRYSELLAFIMCADIVETPKPAPEPEPVVEKDGKEYIKIGKKEYEVLARNEDGSITSDDDTPNNG